MTDDRENKIQKGVARLANGFILQYLLAQHFKATGDPIKASSELLDLCEKLAEKMTFDHLDPAESDVAAQEYRDHLIRLVLRGRALATGEPFDPEAYRRSWRSKP